VTQAFFTLALCIAVNACIPSPAAEPVLPLADFPQEPVIDGTLPSDAAAALSSAFAGAEQAAGGPCMTEPAFGALYPRNFTPPFFEWLPGSANENVFELRLHIDNQHNDFVLYTDRHDYTLSETTWTALVSHSQDRDISVSIRSARVVEGSVVGVVLAGSAGTVRIAPADAPGTIVYWTTSNGSALKGFRIGDRDVRTVLSPDILAAAGQPTRCIGCHTSAPDGQLAFFGRADPQFSVDARKVDGTGAASAAGRITANAMSNLSRFDQDLPVLSAAHYSPTDSVVITTLYHADTANKWELVWTDLLATSGGTGILPRIGDSKGAAHPTWSHDGNTLVYVSTNAIASARIDRGEADLWAVPYNGRAGGQAEPIPGINLVDTNQYYPAFSPQDKLLAFNRNPRGAEMYDAADSEVWIANSFGGESARLPANDSPACTGQVSPGLTNSWPRWAPNVWNESGKKYYWLVFSSKRRTNPLTGNPIPQLFMAAVVSSNDSNGIGWEILTPALYITTQPVAESNHTPVWDDFVIPAG
jgi:Tol biopolymer transport system component